MRSYGVDILYAWLYVNDTRFSLYNKIAISSHHSFATRLPRESLMAMNLLYIILYYILFIKLFLQEEIPGCLHHAASLFAYEVGVVGKNIKKSFFFFFVFLKFQII